MIVSRIALSAALLCAMAAPFAAAGEMGKSEMAAPMADKKDGMGMGKHDSMQDKKMGGKDAMSGESRMDKMDRQQRPSAANY